MQNLSFSNIFLTLPQELYIQLVKEAQELVLLLPSLLIHIQNSLLLRLEPWYLQIWEYAVLISLTRWNNMIEQPFMR